MHRRNPSAVTLIASLFVASGLWLAGCDQLKSIVTNADPIEECVDSKLFADKQVCVHIEYKDKAPAPEAPAVK
jgi:hypothetical protein